MPCHAHPLTIPDPTRCTHPVLSPDSDLSLLVATSSCPPPTSLSAPGLYYRPSPPHLSPCLLHMILPLSIQVLCLSTPPIPVSQPIVTAISPTISYRLPISPQSVYVTRTTSSFKPTTLTALELYVAGCLDSADCLDTTSEALHSQWYLPTDGVCHTCPCHTKDHSAPGRIHTASHIYLPTQLCSGNGSSSKLTCFHQVCIMDQLLLTVHPSSSTCCVCFFSIPYPCWQFPFPSPLSLLAPLPFPISCRFLPDRFMLLKRPPLLSLPPLLSQNSMFLAVYNKPTASIQPPKPPQ